MQKFYRSRMHAAFSLHWFDNHGARVAVDGRFCRGKIVERGEGHPGQQRFERVAILRPRCGRQRPGGSSVETALEGDDAGFLAGII